MSQCHATRGNVHLSNRRTLKIWITADSFTDIIPHLASVAGCISLVVQYSLTYLTQFTASTSLSSLTIESPIDLFCCLPFKERRFCGLVLFSLCVCVCACEITCQIEIPFVEALYCSLFGRLMSLSIIQWKKRSWDCPYACVWTRADALAPDACPEWPVEEGFAHSKEWFWLED